MSVASLAYGRSTGRRYLGSQLEDPRTVLDCVLTEWYFSELAQFAVYISPGYGVIGGSVRGTTARGLRTGPRYLYSQIEDPITALDSVIQDWYFYGLTDILACDVPTVSTFGVIGGSVVGDLTLQAPFALMDSSVSAGAPNIDYTHAFGLKTGFFSCRLPYSQCEEVPVLEDTTAVLNVVLTDWYFRGWDLWVPVGAVVSTEYRIVGGSGTLTASGAVVSSEFGVVGGTIAEDVKIQGAVVSTHYWVVGGVGRIGIVISGVTIDAGFSVVGGSTFDNILIRGAVISTGYGVVGGLVVEGITIQSAIVSTAYGVVGGVAAEGLTIQGVVISTEYNVLGGVANNVGTGVIIDTGFAVVGGSFIVWGVDPRPPSIKLEGTEINVINLEGTSLERICLEGSSGQ